MFSQPVLRLVEVRSSLLLVLMFFALAGPGLAQSSSDEGVDWGVSSRDVYVDGVLRPDVTVLTSSEPDRLALLIPGAADSLIVESVESDDEGTEEVRLLSLTTQSFTFTEPLNASSQVPEDEASGLVTLLPEGILVVRDELQLLVLPHQGVVGDLDQAELWRQAPVWRQLYDAYEPAAAALEVLRSQTEPLHLTVAFGTWCGDSRRSVPRLLKALSLADNANIAVELVAIERGFTKPLEFARRHQLTNVPTVIAAADRGEIGRFVENPRSEAVENDLAAMLSARPLPAVERFRDGDQLVAQATLGLFAAQRRIGEERWRFYSTEAGGSRLWIRLRDEHGITETWQSFNEKGHSTFVEVTRSTDDEHSRTRLSRRGDTARSTTRGDSTGIIKQTVNLPSGAVLLPPGTSGLTQAWRQAGRLADARSVHAHVLAAAGGPAPGKVSSIKLARLPEQPVKFDGETIDAVGLEVGLEDRSGRYWLHPELDLPVLVELDNGRRLVLESLMVAQDSEPQGTKKPSPKKTSPKKTS